MTATAITSLGEVTEVPEKAKRWTYTFEYKVQIVKQAEAGKPRRRRRCFGEGLCSSSRPGTSTLGPRRAVAGVQVEEGGPRAVPVDARDKKIADLSTPPRGGRRHSSAGKSRAARRLRWTRRVRVPKRQEI